MQLLGMNPRELSLSHSASLLKIGRKMSFVSNSKLFSSGIICRDLTEIHNELQNLLPRKGGEAVSENTCSSVFLAP